MLNWQSWHLNPSLASADTSFIRIHHLFRYSSTKSKRLTTRSKANQIWRPLLFVRAQVICWVDYQTPVKILSSFWLDDWGQSIFALWREFKIKCSCHFQGLTQLFDPFWLLYLCITTRSSITLKNFLLVCCNVPSNGPDAFCVQLVIVLCNRIYLSTFFFSTSYIVLDL